MVEFLIKYGPNLKNRARFFKLGPYFKKVKSEILQQLESRGANHLNSPLVRTRRAQLRQRAQDKSHSLSLVYSKIVGVLPLPLGEVLSLYRA